MIRLIIEGVAGTGKSTIISQLRQAADLQDALFIQEEITLGELFSEIQNKNVPMDQHLKRLQSVLDQLSSANGSIVLERFHPSYYALGINWDWLRSIDQQLARLHFKTALLDINEDQFNHRCLKRPERAHEGWEDGFVSLYGSAENAVAAFKKSQQLRRDSLALSELPSDVFNTTTKQWQQTTQEILKFARIF